MPVFHQHRPPALRLQRGVTSIEYALLGALIAMAIALTVSELGTAVAALYQYIADAMP